MCSCIYIYIESTYLYRPDIEVTQIGEHGLGT